jgi:hypothetical protein
MWNVVERRVERSSHLESALQLMLRSQRQRGELELIVLATSTGELVAHDGPLNLSEEIAAYAPLLAKGIPVAIDSRRIRGVTVHAFVVGREELILAIRGSAGQAELNDVVALATIQGATRILRG